MDSLWPVIVGGLIALIGGLIGAWIQSRREHAKWVRERRYEAYVNAVALTGKQIDRRQVLRRIQAETAKPGVNADKLRPKLTAARTRFDESSDERAQITAPLAILGPPTVLAAFDSFIDSANATEKDPGAEATFIQAIRNTLGIQD